MKDFKFPKNCRLLNKADFEFLRTGSRRFYFDHLIFFYKPSRLVDLKCNRIGFSISKNLGNAVKRNTVKRVLRDEFRTNHFKNGNFDILITVNFKKLGKRPNIDSDFLDSARKELSLALEKISPQIV